MNQWRRIVAVGLVLSLYHLALLQSASAAAVPTASVRDQVTAFGVGAKVGLKLAGGEKVRGSIESIDDQGFVLAENGKATRHVPYEQVAQLNLAQRSYRAKGDPDPTQARRMVVALGVGKHVGVKFAGREVHGHIQSIAPEHFTVIPDRETAPVQIAYNDVRYVEKNLSFGSMVVLVVLIVAAVVVIGIAASR